MFKAGQNKRPRDENTKDNRALKIARAITATAKDVTASSDEE